MKLHPEKYAAAEAEETYDEIDHTGASVSSASERTIDASSDSNATQSEGGKTPFEEVRAMYAAQEVTEQAENVENSEN